MTSEELGVVCGANMVSVCSYECSRGAQTAGGAKSTRSSLPPLLLRNPTRHSTAPCRSCAKQETRSSFPLHGTSTSALCPRSPVSGRISLTRPASVDLRRFSSAMTLTLLNLVPVPLPTQPPSFMPSVAEARKLITSRTRAIVLVTPGNPTGAVASSGLIQGQSVATHLQLR